MLSDANFDDINKVDVMDTKLKNSNQTGEERTFIGRKDIPNGCSYVFQRLRTSLIDIYACRIACKSVM